VINEADLKYIVQAEGTVIRPKENTYFIVRAKLSEVFQSPNEVEGWLDLPRFLLNHKTARQTIEEGNGHQVERLVDMELSGHGKL
jgi:hypothetical protein